MLYTRKGDDGTSGLFGSAARLPKDCPLFEALGTVDELNSLLGVCFAKANTEALAAIATVGLESSIRSNEYTKVANLLREQQQHLFVVQAELAGADKRFDQSQVEQLEATIADLEQKFENPHAFVIAGGSELSALLDYARAVSRRAERHVLLVREEYPTSPAAHKYLNRLSSFLYALARFANTLASSLEQKPTYS